MLFLFIFVDFGERAPQSRGGGVAPDAAQQRRTPNPHAPDLRQPCGRHAPEGQRTHIDDARAAARSVASEKAAW